MHVYGSLAQPPMFDRWAAPTAPNGRVAPRTPTTWVPPDIATRVDLPAPAVWEAPNPELLLSITIAPLRLTPVSWGPPVVVQSPWGPPVLDRLGRAAGVAVDPSADRTAATEPAGAGRLRRTRALAFGLATTAVGVAGTVAIVLAR